MFQSGFLGYPTTFMLDFVVCALVLIVPLLIYSLWLVKIRRHYLAHKRLQIALGLVLLVAVSAFEIDVQLVHGGWEQIVARQNLAPELLEAKIAAVRPWLLVHLVFAVSTPFLWATTMIFALMKFGRDAKPGGHSRLHRILGWLSTLDITLTSVTGLLFYYQAFIPSG